MTARISLALVIHNHQPVGNFGWVFEEVYDKAYEPMIDALERHPAIHVGIHYTGPLLEWMEQNRPESIARLRALSDSGQVEILGGGLYEPILVSLPQRDRRAQLVRMRGEVERLFGKAPNGAWLAERVWEPSLPFDLADAGYRYTVLDDNHLRGAAVKDKDMWGTYTTDDQGRLLTIFGTEKGLRYRIPWQPVDDLISYLKGAAEAGDGHRLGIMGDDGEKFGGWPGTYELCWGQGKWIDDCFNALAENGDWLSTVTPAAWMASEPPLGRIYVPTASYVEMTEWALPPDDALVFHDAIEKATEEGSAALPFLTGAMWRNFQARYREINDLHKQMLRVSAAVDSMPDDDPTNERAEDHLHRGQSNDCYWHGLFGGVYIVHMRMATLSHLIAAEDLAVTAAEGSAVLVGGVGDYDLDGIDELMLVNDGVFVLVDVAEGAGIGSWDLRASRVALASVLRRRPEAYHQKLRDAEAAAAAGEATEADTISPHESVATKEPGLSAALVYDDHERRSGLVRFVDGSGREVGDFVSGPWETAEVTHSRLVTTRSADGLTGRKAIHVDGGRMDPRLGVDVSVVAETAFTGALELEMNVNLSGGGGNPDAYYLVAEVESRHDESGNASEGAEVAFGNRYEGVEVRAVAEPPAAVSWSPVETVSNSEAGFEKTYQGSCLLFRWPLNLAAGQEMRVEVRFIVTQTRDRAANEQPQVAESALI